MEFRLGPRRRSPRLLALGGEPDLISTLPDDLLVLVLAHLPCASAAVRTGILSRRWRGLWARLRRIVFSDIALPSLETALGRFPPPPPAVSLLQIRLPKEHHRADTASISSLLGAAARFHPEELVLVLPSRFVISGSLVLELPCFHRATSIVLDLRSTNICVPAGIEFPALETLSLSHCNPNLEALLSRCPRLRVLQLANVWFYNGVLSVNSPLLQELVVARETQIKHVNIVTPVLTQLTMSLKFYDEKGDISILAPMVEKVSWDCYLSGRYIKFGLWRLMKLSLHNAERQGQLPSLQIHACVRPSTIHGEPDIISALPDDLLFLVLARLPCASAAARTGVLSRRWRGLWPCLRRIVFNDIEFPSLEKAISRFPPPPPAFSLLQIRLPKPREHVRKKHRADTASFNSLLRAAARIDPEEFFLIFPSSLVLGRLVLDLPRFHRATSIVLDLYSTIRCVPAGVEFPALETLSLCHCIVDLDVLLPRCPRLRTLRLAKVWLHKDVLSVNSPLLRELVVARATWIKHVNIVAPILTQLTITMSLHPYQNFGISILAPMLEKVSWNCRLAGPSTTFGLWRLVQLRLQTAKRQRQLPSLHIHACISPSTTHDEAENFTQEIEKHVIAEFAVLKLHLEPKGHVFGALAFRLLGMNQVCSALQRLNVILKRSTVKEECALDCPCEPSNWRFQTISLNALEYVEINGFDGDDHEIDFLKLLFKCAPTLRRMAVKLSHDLSLHNDGCAEIYNIFGAYSSVKCYVYLSSGE